ncbi:PREDICTED: SCO-spondin-like [Priapulus caudatus]|uniref:SCO-spondin-like n=1 Tax=Priapulus caudatus TaxID=37621 RepID=A0ABM1EWS9_PRICU|nr:PREDICTED: SCO-spondin-like [Priapulus caudatus]
MRSFLILAVCVAAAVAIPLRSKRFGTPIEVEDACNPNLGNQTFADDPNDCGSFYICKHGWPVSMRCPGDSIWTPETERCEVPHNATNEACGFVAPTTESPDLGNLEGYPGPCSYECDDGGCVGLNQVCDGVANCEDGTDEPEEYIY